MTNKRKPRAVGYRRVSTNGQLDGYGLDLQDTALTEHCEAGGLRLVAVFTDEGESGGEGLDVRVELAEALRMLADDEADILVIPRLDRLARDVVLQEQLLREVWSMGKAVESTMPAESAYLGDDLDEVDPSRALIRTILGAVAQYDRALTKLRLRGGRRRKGAQGGYIGGDVIPLGKRVEGQGKAAVLIDDEDEAATVERISELHEAGESLRSIAATLTDEGHATKRGGRWQPETVKRVIARL